MPGSPGADIQQCRLAWTFFASNYSVVGVVVVPWWQEAIIIAGSLVVVTALETATDVV
jgi:hypothetical protein